MNSIECPPVVDVHGENIEEENIKDGGLAMENLVDTFCGIHEEPHVGDDSGHAGVSEEPYVSNDKYNKYKRMSIEKLYPLCGVLRLLFLRLWSCTILRNNLVS